jgi:hypothetical protein
MQPGSSTAQSAPVDRLLRRIRESVIGDDRELPADRGTTGRSGDRR